MKNELRSIKIGGIGKRLIALIMDAAVAFFTFGMLAAWIFAPISESAFNYSLKGKEGLEYQVFSKLFVYEQKVDDDHIIIIENQSDLEKERSGDTNLVPLHEYNFENKDQYLARLQYYYCSYLTGDDLVFEHGAPVKYEQIELSDGTLVDPRVYYYDNISTLTDINEIKDACYTAEYHFYYSDYMTSINNELKLIQLFIVIPPYLISFGIYFILIPLLFENGETLAKKVVHLGFITKDGYSIKKRQIVYRQLILFIYITLCLFIVGVGTTSLATLGLGGVIYILTTVFAKDRRSFVDKLAYLTLIDSQSSVWFSSPEVEEERQKELDAKMKEYKKKKVENKNLIQVGTTIVDEKYKK